MRSSHWLRTCHMTISSHLIGCLDISSDYMECVGINVEVLYLNSKYTVMRRSGEVPVVALELVL